MKRLFKHQTLFFSLLILNLFFFGGMTCGSNTPEKTETTAQASDISITLDNMQVVYMGVENPITINANKKILSTLELNDFNVKGPVLLKKIEEGKFSINASRLGIAEIGLNLPNKMSYVFKYRIKRLPNPVARLGNIDSRIISAEEFKKQSGIGAWFDDFDFDVRCRISGFTITRINSKGKKEIVANKHARFEEHVQKILDKAQTGDVYYITNIKSQCPDNSIYIDGEPSDKPYRILNSLVFEIE